MVAKIEYIEETIAAYERAAEANHQTPGREGNVIEVSAELADDVMITADLHGHRKNFGAIKRIADLDAHPRRHLIMQEVCHGGPTYPSNGGCMSHGMLEDVARLKVRYPDRLHFLMSNHELAELTDYPILKQKKMLNLMFRLGMQQAYGPAMDKVREAMLAFLRSCPLAVRLPGGVFVCHSAPSDCDRGAFDPSIFHRSLRAEDYQERRDVFNLVWGRDYRQENADAFARMVGADVLIHGHEPCMEKGYDTPNDRQIILDCCCDWPKYVILPTDRNWSQNDVVRRIKPLE